VSPQHGALRGWHHNERANDEVPVEKQRILAGSARPPRQPMAGYARGVPAGRRGTASG
jgi:hypothetical protein